MYQALYRKYRPKQFEDVSGQNIIIKTLENSVINDKISHAYLFTGPRGTGKTSTAKIFAKIVNCKNLNNATPCNECDSCVQFNNNQNIDIIEIDAASNNGVDEIRELREKVNLVPNIGKYKVYIIDEVHMLTTAAFNALLKTLEEPPKHIIFILATTEPHKIPTTILSRCQRFDFKKISVDSILKRLAYICEKENISITDDAIKLIANLSDGGMRDSINLLDQLTSYTSDKITIQDVHDIYGTITNEEIFNFFKYIINDDMINVFNLINSYESSGKNLSKIVELIIEFLRNTLIYIYSSSYFENEDEKQMYNEVCTKISEEQIYVIIEILLDIVKNSKNTVNTKLLFELAVIKIFEKLNLGNNIENIAYNDNINLVEEKKIETNIEFKKNIKNSYESDKNNELKKIRINNTLFFFNKKELLSFVKKIDKLKDYLTDIEYGSISSFILDGTLKAKGREYLIFVYDEQYFADYFNSSLSIIEQILKKVFNDEFKPIAVTSDEWTIIKDDFNKSVKENIKKYKFIEEIKEEEKNNNITNKSVNKIDEMFENIIEYK